MSKKEKLKCVRRVHKKIGDVIEIPTSKGLTYVQYTHQHTTPPVWDSLIRVLQGFYKKRLANEEIATLVNQPHRFQTFCLLQTGIKKDEVKLMGNFLVPEFVQKFPVFRASNNMPKKDPLEKIWWLWDGEKEWKVGKLSFEEQMKYPLKQLCDVTALIGDIETGKSFSDILC
jgi:hypothetical protein